MIGSAAHGSRNRGSVSSLLPCCLLSTLDKWQWGVSIEKLLIATATATHCLLLPRWLYLALEEKKRIDVAAGLEREPLSCG